MAVSILVPIYHVEKYIERCARSLFEQTYPDIEYIGLCHYRRYFANQWQVLYNVTHGRL